MFRDCSLTWFKEGVFLIVLFITHCKLKISQISSQLQLGHAQTVNHCEVLVNSTFFFVFFKVMNMDLACRNCAFAKGLNLMLLNVS